MRIVVLAGGMSTERDVSLMSGTMICNTLRENGHEAILVDTFLGCPDAPEDLDELFRMDGSLLEKPHISSEEPDLDLLKKTRADKSDAYFGPNVIELCKKADICFMGLHGGAGESGQVQAHLDMLGIKYTGTGFISSVSAMHKGVTKAIFLENHVPTTEGFLLRKEEKDLVLAERGYDFPVVVKVCMGGSSIGVYIVYDEASYRDVIENLFRTEKELLIEKYVKGREFAVGVVDGIALPVIEIIPNEGWFDYANKYQDGVTREVCPAELDEEIAERMKCAAEAAFLALGLEVYGRMDFLLDEKGEIYCLEANSLPGMTPASLMPKEAEAAGIPYPDFCELIIEKSLEKYRDRSCKWRY